MSSWMFTWNFKAMSISERIKFVSAITVSISLAMLSFETSYELKSFNRNVYNLGMSVPLLSTAILLFCCAYQREKKVVFNKFKEIDVCVCIINFIISLCCSTTLIKGSMLYGAYSAVHVAICGYIAMVLFGTDVYLKIFEQEEPVTDSPDDRV